MANPSMPIRRLELEFIPSNITSFEHIVKIWIIRNPSLSGTIEFVTLNKYVIDKDDTSLFEDATQYLQYMSNSVYMSESIYMGGLDILSYAKDSATVTIRSANIDTFRFLLDYMLDQNDVLMYSLSYRYKGTLYTTPLVVSYKPVESEPLSSTYSRPCITLRNLRYRGPNESQKYSNMHKEMYCDMRRLNSMKDNVDSSLEANMSDIDDDFNSLYNIKDSVDFYKSCVLDQETT